MLLLSVYASHPHWTSTTVPVTDCVSAVSALSSRYRLRSTGSADYVVPRTRTRFGERGFSYCGPAAWNTLPSDLHDITDTGTFRKRLRKRVYFTIVLTTDYCWRSWMCRIAAPYKNFMLLDWLIMWQGSAQHIRQPRAQRDAVWSLTTVLFVINCVN